MDNFVAAVSRNTYLNSLAIFITLAGALIFLWANRTVIGRVFGALWRVTLGRFVTSLEETRRHTKMGIQYERYLIAVTARHFAVALLGIWFFALIRDLQRSLVESHVAGAGLSLSLGVLLNVLVFIVGSRLFDVIIICRRIIEAHDAVEREREDSKKEKS